MSTLQNTIQEACEAAYDDDANQIVGRIPVYGWVYAHKEDSGRIAEMTAPTFEVTADGVLPEHIERGEITED